MEKVELEALLQSLSVPEKVHQLVQLNGNFFSVKEEIATGPSAKIGMDSSVVHQVGSILNTFGAKNLKELQKRYMEQHEHHIPMLFMADIINGYRTVFPISLALGCSFDEALVKRTAQIAAQEASVSGIHVTFSPMVDVVRDARWGRVMESYGEDTYLNCLFAKAMVEGYQQEEHNVFACVKHFAGYGAPLGGREYNTVELGERSLREHYLPSYKAAVDAGCHLVMTSFNTIDGIPATANRWLLDDVLRKEWGFQGTVISDHSAVKELIPHGVAKDEKEAAKLAFTAGCDIDMMTSIYANHIEELLAEGSISMAQLDDACRRVLALKNELGLFENPYRFADEAKEKQVQLCKEYRDFACEVVTKTCVLLQNNNQVLPLAKDKNIALVGPYAQERGLYGMWSFTTDPNTVVTLEEGFLSIAKDAHIYTAQGASFLDRAEDIPFFGKVDATLTTDNREQLCQEAIEAATKSDVIICALGEHAQQSGEGGARASLTISDGQMYLLKEMRKLGKPVIVLLFSGRPLQVDEIEANCDALLQCWFPGIEGGNGIAKLIYGEANPSGRLVMSFPYRVGQCPIFYNHLNTGRPALTSTHSQRFTSRYIDTPNGPQHCFGYGLSYSEFIYENITLDHATMKKDEKLHVLVDVTNVSDTAGIETVQLYLRDVCASIARPVKELKGVQKVNLAPHEKKTVTFTIREDMLRFVNRDMKYVSEPGEFIIYIGKNSEDTLSTNFTLV